MPTFAIDRQIENTVQSATRSDRELGIGLLFWLARSGEILPPWWSKERDKHLRNTYKESDHMQGAFWMMATKLASVPYNVEARDASVTNHRKLASQYQAVCSSLTQFGQGWEDFWQRFLIDLWTQDNGAFGEVIGEGDPNGPIKGPALGLAHLDAWRCSRTSNPEFPVIYQDVDGKLYRFHHTRCIYTSQMPSASAEMYGVGHCWLTRAVNSMQRLVDIAVYGQEKLGSRPLRQILLGGGIGTDSLIEAIKMAEEGMDNQGLRRYAKTVVIGDEARTDINLQQIDMASLPDGFDERVTTDLAMYVIALAGGFPPRWLWPASTTGATKADAMYSHIAGTGGGASWHLSMMANLLSYDDRAGALAGVLPPKFLPKELKLVFDYQDDEQDRQQADVRAVRASTRKEDIETGVITVRVAREQALSVDDITEAQFDALELEDGRLPNGNDVLVLFSSLDPFFVGHLDLGIDDPLSIDLHDPLDMMIEIEEAALNAQDVLVNATAQAERLKADQALAALGKLKGMYEELAAQAIAQEQMVAQEGQQPQAPEEKMPSEEGETPPPEQEGEEEQPPAEGEPEQPPVEEKGYNYGAKVGETISGQLARGEGGRFANAQEVAAAKNELLANLIARLRAKRGGEGRGGAVEARKAENRAKIGELEGVGGDTVDSLAAMRSGGDVEPATLDALQKRGLAQVNADGSVTMSTAGRALLTAANTGDVDKAKKALADASKPGKGGKGKKGGKGGKAPKPTPEQAAQEKKNEEARQRDATFAEMGEQLGVESEDMRSLFQFNEGDELADPEAAQRLEDAGFVERDSEGNLRMTSDGRAILSAGTKGDKRRALDVASRARDKKTRAREREEAAQAKRQEQAAKKREDAAKLQQTIDEQEEKLAQMAGVGRDAQQREIIRARIEHLQQRMAELNAEADELEAKEVAVSADPFEVKAGGTDQYRRMIRSAVRGLWNGTLDFYGFWDAMSSAINLGTTGAWYAGARECGIKPDELSQEERLLLSQRISYEHRWIAGYAEAIEANRAAGGKLASLYSRAEIWIGRWDGVRSEARAMACADKKLKWVLGEAEHCSSCLKLAGKVKRASYWAERSIYPRVHGAWYLECNGFRCRCSLVQTDDPLSKGPLPNLP